MLRQAYKKAQFFPRSGASARWAERIARCAKYRLKMWDFGMGFVGYPRCVLFCYTYLTYSEGGSREIISTAEGPGGTLFVLLLNFWCQASQCSP